MARAVQVARAVPAEPEEDQVVPTGPVEDRVVLAGAQVAPAEVRAVLEVAQVVPAGTIDPALGAGGIKN